MTDKDFHGIRITDDHTEIRFTEVLDWANSTGAMMAGALQEFGKGDVRPLAAMLAGILYQLPPYSGADDATEVLAVTDKVLEAALAAKNRLEASPEAVALTAMHLLFNTPFKVADMLNELAASNGKLN